MAKASIFNINGVNKGQYELPEILFGATVNEHAVHMAVVQYLANQRQGTQSAKTRAEVRGGGRKPYAQKGTGRARQGSIRSPQWTGGGIVFAPKPRDYSMKLNKKMKRVALKSALTARANANGVTVMEDMNLEAIKTKSIVKLLSAIGLGKTLIVTEEPNHNVILSANNIPNVEVTFAGSLNVYDIVKYDNLLITQAAIEKLVEVYA